MHRPEIAVQPEVLLMDEPCSALDPISTRAIEDLIRQTSLLTDTLLRDLAAMASADDRRPGPRRLRAADSSQRRIDHDADPACPGT